MTPDEIREYNLRQIEWRRVQKAASVDGPSESLPMQGVGCGDLLGEKRYERIKRQMDRERDEYQSTRLLSEQALDLCHAIERGVACEQLTKCSVLAAQLRRELDLYELTRPLEPHEQVMIQKGWEKFRDASPNGKDQPPARG